MFGRLLCGLGLTALVLVGPSRADGDTTVGAGDVGVGVQIECAQWTLPVDITGMTFTAGPYPTKAAAIAASGDLQTLVNAIGNSLWPGFTCPGCPDNQPGCDKGIEFITLPGGTGVVRQGAGGWYVDWTATGGKVSASCSDCPDADTGGDDTNGG